MLALLLLGGAALPATLGGELIELAAVEGDWQLGGEHVWAIALSRFTSSAVKRKVGTLLRGGVVGVASILELGGKGDVSWATSTATGAIGRGIVAAS